MPIFEYRCSNCKRKEEKIVLYPHAPQETINCNSCTGEARRIVSSPVMRPDPFWSGFYDGSLDVHFSSREEHARKSRELGFEPSDFGEKAVRVKERKETKRREAITELVADEVQSAAL